ncbi:MAG: carbohydrate-binding domain-containing protein [Candidatus Cellulosilyticum pullistercoris]|uniref:Carbohydrate-binding domain-containing protein n=1 Tax=Candidatus Cellulosilyticum pullistercoris TaxID=2838521 RepID=A0A9E2KDF2_9FIRM|nr:carbohydrate-binding domain-containing protein [Candidatus Cellulosilyticum pullistercoris]
MKSKIILGTILSFSLFLLGLMSYSCSPNNKIPSENINAVLSILEDDVSGIAWSNQSTVNLNSLSASNSQGIEFTSSGVVITDGGNYIFSGTLKNGSITVNTDEVVNLTLNKASITNPSGPALYIKNAAQTYVTLISNTKNFLVDGKDHSNPETAGAIYTNAPIIFQGGGSLDITSISFNGISSHAPIIMNNCALTINGVTTQKELD